MADQLQAELQVLDDALRAAEEDITKLQNKLRDARTKQNAIATRLESATNRVRMREMYAGNRTAEAFSAGSSSSTAAPTRSKAMPTRWASATSRRSRKRWPS